MVEFLIECALPGGIQPSDHWFDQPHDDTCSRCRKPIPDTDVPLLLWAGKGTRMLAYCAKCQEPTDEHDNDNCSNICDFPAERLVRRHDDRAGQAGAPGPRAGGDAEGAPADLAAEKRHFLIWSNEEEEWWGPGFDGYTPLISRAGRYRIDEATIICSNNNCHCRPTDEPAVVMVLAPEELPPPLAVANRPGLTEDLATG